MNGHLKVLNVSERNRGYLFVTKDKIAMRLFGESIKIRYQGSVSEFKFDKFGRAHTGKLFLNKLPNEFNLQYKDEVLEITL